MGSSLKTQVSCLICYRRCLSGVESVDSISNSSTESIGVIPGIRGKPVKVLYALNLRRLLGPEDKGEIISVLELIGKAKENY